MNHHSIRVLLGTPLPAKPKPWLYFRVPGIVINAFQLYKSPSILEKIREVGGVRKYLEVTDEVEIWVDSGGFQFMRHGISITVSEIARVYRVLKDVDYFVNLDYPPTPYDTTDEAKKKIIATHRNYIFLTEYLGRDKVVPVLHIQRSLELIRTQVKLYENCEKIAIGGLVPYILISRGVRRSREYSIYVLKLFRDYFSGTRIHVLGIGSPTVVPILSVLNIDSTDSSTWRVKAAYGKVIVPGVGERHVTNRVIRFGKRRISSSEFSELINILRITGFPLSSEVNSLLTTFEGRALINAWVLIYAVSQYPLSPPFQKLLKVAMKIRKVPREEVEKIVEVMSARLLETM